ncbi:MAG: methyltransferase [Cyanobacteria bacterium J06597_16]
MTATITKPQENQSQSAPSQGSLAHQSALIKMASATWVSKTVYVAAKLGIADLLSEGPKSSTELAAATQTDAPSLFRLLRALASLGIFTETEPSCFALAPTGHFLRSDIPDSLRGMAILHGEDDYKAWDCLLNSVKTGESAFKKLYDMPVFEYMKQNAASAKTFDAAMTSYSSTAIPAILSGYDFSNTTVLLDVGGGVGSLLVAILQANPHLKGILCELPPVIEKAEAFVANSKMAERTQLVAGDFFKSVPSGADTCLLKHIIHNWDDDEAIAILEKCRQALTTDGKLLLVEHIITPGDTPCFGKLFDVSMLLWCEGGKERTELEYNDLLRRAGFELTQVIPTQTPLSMIEAVPIA